jgi:hypothetical protein
MSPWADLDRDGWELEDVVQKNRENPETFHIASEAERKGLKPGDLVKLIFLFLDHDEEGEFVQGERMHVRVRETTAEGYVGVLEDAPAATTLLQRGSPIAFGAEHVATIYLKKP